MTTDILNEYSEILEEFYDSDTALLFLSAVDLLPNIYIQKYFFGRLIPQDEDDEKFVDCAIAAGAEYLITNDRHFNHLKVMPFPVVKILNEDEFREVFEARYGDTSEKGTLA